MVKHLVKPLGLLALGAAFMLFAAPLGPDAEAQQLSAKQYAAQKSRAKHYRRRGRRSYFYQHGTRYNFRKRTYFPWYEGTTAEAFYMQFDKRFGD
jgi:hypothetical protein